MERNNRLYAMDQIDVIAIEREARRMQAQALRAMLRGFGAWFGRQFGGRRTGAARA